MKEGQQNTLTLPGAIIIAGALVAIAILVKWTPASVGTRGEVFKLNTAVLVDAGHILPVNEEQRLLQLLVANGSIDPEKLPQVTELNLLWAFGLANKNQVLEEGPIADRRYGSPVQMASVGGWTVSQGSAMDHYSKHTLVTLTPDQQALVLKMAKGIYRPCCGNSTHFPDCNHGMAMLGLLEYLAANGATEDQMWGAAMAANTIWFPSEYQTITTYLKEVGRDITTVSPQELLGFEYSSANGFAKIASQVKNPIRGQGSGCGVGVGQIQSPQKGGCGI